METDQLLIILGRVPPTHLKILQLAKELTLPSGELDITAASERVEELHEASQEARQYTNGTHTLEQSIQCLTDPFQN